MTNGSLVSRVRNGLNSLNKDMRISNRYILSVAENNVKALLPQLLEKGGLSKDFSLITTIECFNFKQVDTVTCDIVEFRRSDNLMKSVNRLPELIHSRYGSSIFSITSIDGLHEFNYITPRQYILNKNRRFANKFNHDFYYIFDNFIYLPDSTVSSVNVDIITIDRYSALKLSGCGKDSCINIWDLEFVCPDKLLDTVIKSTIGEVSTKLNIPTDENPNLDSNIKTQTVK